MKGRLIITVLLMFCLSSFSQRINIGIYYESKVTAFVFTPTNGNYTFFGDSATKYEVPENDVIYVALMGDSINIKSLDKNFGNFSDIMFIGDSEECSFKIKPVFPDITTRMYDNDLRVVIRYKRLMLVNHVELESYISGVVESEGGSNSPVEYYKSQAIICRTYALANFNRHATEGFNLCDGVHCQAYKSKCDRNTDIISATLTTKGLIIVDTTLSLITSAFHSNCGGQTCNSEDAWVSKLSYLRSINDPHCTTSRNARWSKTVPVYKWKAYLRKNGIEVSDNSPAGDFAFYQKRRKRNYTYKGKSIPVKKIRVDWGFKSAFFSVIPDGNNLLFRGKGYGHGVGLCQEGAMRMAEKGYTYDKIIKFYYTNTYTISLRALEFFKEPVKINTIPADEI